MFGWNRSSTNQKSSAKDKKIIGLQEIKGCNNPDRIGDVIFVHGLGGNLRSTWHPEELQDDNFWLNWLSQDQTDIGIWSFGYEAQPFEWRGKAMPLFDQASNLLEWLETKGLNERPIIFVTHSLGGLLVKKMLNTAQTFKKQKLIEQIKGIIFLATPHTGSHLANLISNIGTLTRTTISVKELKSHAPQLRELNEWYRENVRGFGIITKVYYETRSVHGISVVDEDSANPGIEGVKPVAVPEDHITIAKPTSKDNLVYIGVEHFILDNFKPSFNNYDGDIALTELAVQEDGRFVGGTDAVRRVALTLLDPSWDGNLTVHSAAIEAIETELRELESLFNLSAEQGDRIVSLRGHLSVGQVALARVVIALRLTFIPALRRERTWGALMELEDATIFIESLFAYAGLAARSEGDWTKCWVFLRGAGYLTRVDFLHLMVKVMGKCGECGKCGKFFSLFSIFKYNNFLVLY
jgi:predicted alpha/beta hydrolase family esterase